MKPKRGLLKSSTQGWALSNFGNVWGFHRTRREAIKEAENSIGEPWSKCRKSMEVWKAELRPARSMR